MTVPAHGGSAPPAGPAKGGKGSGAPGLARSVSRVTVRRDRRPAWPLSVRPSLAGSSRALATRRPDALADRPWGGRAGLVPVAVLPEGARRASEGHPLDLRRGPRAICVSPASSLDHSPPSSRSWIRRPPHRRDGGKPRGGSIPGALRTLPFLQAVEIPRGEGAELHSPNINSRRPEAAFGRRCGGEIAGSHEGHQGGHEEHEGSELVAPRAGRRPALGIEGVALWAPREHKLLCVLCDPWWPFRDEPAMAAAPGSG